MIVSMTRSSEQSLLNRKSSPIALGIKFTGSNSSGVLDLAGVRKLTTDR